MRFIKTLAVLGVAAVVSATSSRTPTLTQTVPTPKIQPYGPAKAAIIGVSYASDKFGGEKHSLYGIGMCVCVDKLTAMAAIEVYGKTRCTFYADGACDQTRGIFAIFDGPNRDLMPYKLVEGNRTNSYVCGELKMVSATNTKVT